MHDIGEERARTRLHYIYDAIATSSYAPQRYDEAEGPKDVGVDINKLVGNPLHPHSAIIREEFIAQMQAATSLADAGGLVSRLRETLSLEYHVARHAPLPRTLCYILQRKRPYVAIMAAELPPYSFSGGEGTAVRLLVNAYRALGVRYHVFTYAPEKARPTGHDVDHVTFPAKMIPGSTITGAELVKPFCAHIERHGAPWVVHIHGGNLRDIAVMCCKLRLPLVSTVHSYIHEWIEDQVWQRETRTRFVETHSRAQINIAISPVIARSTVELGVATPNNIACIPNGYAVRPRTRPVPFNVLARKFAMRRGTKYILYVGRLSKQKNIETLLKWYEQSQALRNEVALVVVAMTTNGEDSAIAAVKAAAASGLITHISTLHGDSAHLRALYAHACCLVVPSINEPQGLVTLEAIMAGTVPLVMQGTGAAEICHLCDIGIVFDANFEAFERACMQVISSTDLQRYRSCMRMRENVVKRLCVKAQAIKTVATYFVARQVVASDEMEVDWLESFSRARDAQLCDVGAEDILKLGLDILGARPTDIMVEPLERPFNFRNQG
jgi:glycosyltransferase involved in cell wall biosynthesis